MLSAWALSIHIVVFLCSLLLLLQAYRWKIRMRLQVMIGLVALHSFIQMVGLGERFVGLMNGPSLFIGALSLGMIFLIREAVGETRISSLQVRLSESRFRHPWEWASVGESNKWPTPPTHGPANRRKWTRHSVCAVAKVSSKNGNREIINAVIEDIGLKGLRLRLPKPIPLPAIIKVEARGHKFLGIVRYCEAASGCEEFYAGVEFEHNLDLTALEKFRAEWNHDVISANTEKAP
jgi:hypothetical protein